MGEKMPNIGINLVADIQALGIAIGAGVAIAVGIYFALHVIRVGLSWLILPTAKTGNLKGAAAMAAIKYKLDKKL